MTQDYRENSTRPEGQAMSIRMSDDAPQRMRLLPRRYASTARVLAAPFGSDANLRAVGFLVREMIVRTAGTRRKKCPNGNRPDAVQILNRTDPTGMFEHGL